MNYKHTQVGYLIFSVLFVLALFYAWLYQTIPAEDGSTYGAVSVMVIVLVILASFTTLQVAIDEKYLRIKFGFGIFRKKILLGEIESIKRVKNHWYYGWGMRLWLWPRMWIFNVSGFDAVEVKMKNNTIYRIGTDEPENLERAIVQATKQQ